MLLVYLWFVPNLEVSRTREASGYTTVEQVTETERENADGQLVRQFRFELNKVSYDTTLACFFSHQNAVVWLDGEQVYSLSASPRLPILRTPGCNWAVIPCIGRMKGKKSWWS